MNRKCNTREVFVKIVIGILLVATSCGPKITISKTPSKVTTYSEAGKVNTIFYTPIQVPYLAEVTLDMDVSSKSFSQDVTTKIRFVKDDTTWISITGMFGIEGARLLIVKDTFQMIDRLNKRYYKEHISKAQNLVPLPISIDFIQTMAMGIFSRSIDTLYTKSSIKDTAFYQMENEMMIEKVNIYKEKCVLHAQYYKTKVLHWNVIYSDFKEVSNINHSLPYDRYYTMKINNEDVIIKSKLTEFKTPNTLDFPFVVSDKYQRVKL
jgi:hypothetical protein